MNWASRTTSLRRFCGILVFSALLCLANQVSAQAGDSDDDVPIVFGEDWQPILDLRFGETVENLFLAMVRTDGPDAPCPVTAQAPVLRRPLPAAGSWACARIISSDETASIWRIDFEGAFGAGYRFETLSHNTRQTVLAYPGPGHEGATGRVTAGRRLASLPIVIAPGAYLDVFVQIDTPEDLLDADPVLRPELEFDAIRLSQAHWFGAALGSSFLLFLGFVGFARLLQSPPALRYSVYFAAATVAGVSNAGYLNAFVPGNPILAIGILDKVLEATQVSAHLFFMASFVRDGVPGSRLPLRLGKLAMAAAVVLFGAAAGSVFFGGAAGGVRYHDLGFELDPLFEDPFGSLPILVGATVTALWLVTMLVVSVRVVRSRAAGGRSFALGSGILALGVIATSFGEGLFGLSDDSPLVLQFVLLTDAMVFAAAMAAQAFGLRRERDEAVRQELRATREKRALAESLLEVRRDRDRARSLAEAHRSRLAFTGHDLRQPLTSLHLALEEAEASNPELGRTLRASLDYIRSVLQSTVADTRPEDETEDEGGYHTAVPEKEPVAVEMLLANAVRMFAEEAGRKGLALEFEPTDLVVETEPVAIIRILSNLVSNAVKYTREGGVILRARTIGPSVSIEVHDTGPGLDAAEIEHIRQSYARGSTAGAVEGDGLGLSSVAGFAESLGLTLRIDSTTGRGSCFALEGLSQAEAV